MNTVSNTGIRTQRGRAGTAAAGPAVAAPAPDPLELDPDPGRTVELRTVAGTFSSLKPCEVPRVNFTIGDLGSADATSS